MKRLYSAVALCVALLVVEGVFMLDHTSAKDDVVGQMLRLPAPPPPNPLVKRYSARTADPANADKPPSDDASGEQMVEFYTGKGTSLRSLGYVPEMSDRAYEKIVAEVEKDPKKLPELLGSFKDGERAAEFVKRVYDREGTTGAFDREQRATVKEWLVYHSPYFSDELRGRAQKADDTDTYVTNQEELLQLARFDFDKARPIIDQMYSRDTSKVTRVLARWALYRHALDTDSIGDIDRYRGELQAVVEDRSLSGPMRDLAMDALVSEKSWPGRDEWYYGLLADPTLSDLGGYTGLTTLINVSPPDKYIQKMLELLDSGNPVVRAAAIRNLILKLNAENPDLIRALLPWLDDPKWADDTNNSRALVVRALRTLKIPESVPGLIKVLDERSTDRRTYNGANAAYVMGNAANAVAAGVANAANAAAYASNSSGRSLQMANSSSGYTSGYDIDTYIYRADAIGALGTQGDPQAAGPLRRVLNEVDGYERTEVIKALVKVNGFSVPEEVDALEATLRRNGSGMSNVATADNVATPPDAMVAVNAVANTTSFRPGPPTDAEIRRLLGSYLIYADEISDDLAAGLVDRIGALEQKDRPLAEMLRSTTIKWSNPAINSMMMLDVKSDRTNIDEVVKLLGSRKRLRDTQSGDVVDMRTGAPLAVAVANCILEDDQDAIAILDGDNAETKAALLACGRLTRAKFPVAKVAGLARGGDKAIADAADLYLESEDSREARAVVLSRHPGEAKILGATTAFFPEVTTSEGSTYLYMLFQASDGNDSVYDGWGAEPESELTAIEKRLQNEVKKDGDLIGIYGYDSHYVRIYKDKVIYSWEEDESRYRERPLGDDEFAYLKSYLAQNQVDDILPFAECGGPYCTSRELVMLSRNGGRRVYMSGEPPPFFAGLDKFFDDAKQRPAAVKYVLSREIPGLELLLADDNLHAETVWKNGDDLRVAVTDRVTREHVEGEIDKAVDDTAENSNPDAEEGATDENGESRAELMRAKLTAKRAFEGYSWRSIVNGAAGAIVGQPAGVEFIPIRDGMPAQPTNTQWRARVGNLEVRVGDDGLYKIAGGRAVKLKGGSFGEPLVTPNGRWCLAYSIASDEDDNGLNAMVRINMLTGKMTQIDDTAGYQRFSPVTYIPSLNKVLIAPNYEFYREYPTSDVDSGPEGDDTVAADFDNTEMQFIDPDTGVMTPVRGDVRPLAQQTFRPLQRATTPGTFWAAMPDLEKRVTTVGIYDMRNFSFKPILTVPKITFNSMSMWVDEAGNAVYFVYRGHLLKLPLVNR